MTSTFPRIFSRFSALFLAAAFSCLSIPARAEIKVGVSDWPGWVAWYVAEHNGYFKKYGAKVKLVWFANYTDSISALSAGQLDANCQTWSDTMAPLSKNVPVKAILVNDNSDGNDALMVNPAIKSFADLKGKTIALEQYSISHFVLATALSKNGLSFNDIKTVNLSAGDAAAAFLSGRVDATVVWNPWVNNIQASGKGTALFTSKDMPGLIPDLLVARVKAIETHRAELVGMIKAWQDTQRFIREQPDQAVTVMAKVVGMKPDAYKVFLPGTRFFTLEDNLKALGPASEPASLAAVGPTIAAFLKDNRLIESVPDLAVGVDASLVAEALAAR
ncbi:ABC transporter substrate-binding protein [Methylomonas sp. DH-1]|uniref:ABC transporter substrate-binding protein n=1 Tax=Methylomonas sp. (strain DH-1) TaxID=1727196 RepID=UPI0007C8849C|nr:ABC transporter substrate-binding protein [Methylomonas sp. DH-1]ANE56733.1 aliphatic sulfonate ABC transporter substrate-binding protein [Methylomonas sp. DH-1]